MGRPFKNLRGKTFNDLRVVSDPIRRNGQTVYLVECVTCRRQREAFQGHLAAGRMRCQHCWSLAGRGIDPVLAAAAEAR